MTRLKCPNCKQVIIESHILYRFYNVDGDLMYIGATSDPPGRFKSHQADKEWWGEVAQIRLQHCETRQQLIAAEKAAIEWEQPIHNVLHNKRPAS